MGAVFRFTFSQNTKGKGFIFVTFIVPVIIAFVLGMVIYVSSSRQEKKDKVDYSPVKEVYIDNRTDIEYLDFSDFALFAGEEFSKVKFYEGGHAAKDRKKAVDITIEETDEEYAVNISIPEWSVITGGDAEELNDFVAGYVDKLKIIDAAIKSGAGTADENAMMTALMPVNVEFTTVGDEAAGMGADIVKMLGPMLIIFVMYFMIIIFGQSIGQIVISEKVSKLMETMLLSVKPYQLIAGKILAIVAVAVLQIIMWIAGITVGIVIGDAIAESSNPGYSNIIFEVVNLMKESDALAFSIPAIIISVLVFITGFIFYCVLAGLIASPVSKAEELASSTGIFQFIVVIGFLASYMLPVMGVDNPVVNIVLHIVPVTSAFMLAPDILIGNVAFGAGIGYFVLLIAFTAAAAVYAGRLYRNQVFYNNTSNSLIKKLFK